MDNFRIDVTSEGSLNKVLSLFNKKVEYVSADSNKFRLAWAKPNIAKGEWSKMPYPMTMEEITPFIEGWLNKAANYSRQPDHDGDNGKGWRVYNEDWGHVDNDYAIFAAIEPVWAMYGK